MQRDIVTEVFGLAGTFPRPGWVVLDAARDHRFTGELVFDTAPAVRVYFDRGEIYLAERLTDASLGARLVDAGAVSAAQLERGSVRIGEIEHLGRLFERVPNLDRHTVSVTAELMTEECVGWLAAQRVPDVTWTPYRHHHSGMHLWSRGSSSPDPMPGAPLPAPSADAAPVSYLPPGGPDDVSVTDHTETYLDGLIEWDEPSWLDGTETTPVVESSLMPGDEPVVEAPADGASGPTGPGQPVPHVPDEPADWVDRLELEGLPEPDLWVSPKPLPRLPIEPVDRFELVWPSGEIDEEFGAVESVVGNGHDPDADRVGATARMARLTPDQIDTSEDESITDRPSPPPAEPDVDDDSGTDEVVLAVRRAVASIDVGSLAARQRLVDTTDDLGLGSRGTVIDDPFAVPAPGRVAVRSGRNDWSRRTVTRSVFDEPAGDESETARLVEPVPEDADHRDRRVGALRRLISALRR